MTIQVGSRVRVIGASRYADETNHKIDGRIWTNPVGTVVMAGGFPEEKKWYVGFVVGVRKVKTVMSCFKEAELREEGEAMKCPACGSEMVGEHCPGCLADEIIRVCGSKAVAATRRFCEKVKP